MCAIDVEWFPYDEQNCKLKFGSWTYGADELDLKHWSDMKDVIMTENEKNETIWVLERAIDLSQYHPSNEWDIMSVSGARHSVRYPCCSWTFIDVTYDIRARRKTLFYTVNLTAPTIGLAFLTTIVFYLPAESNEKVVLSVSILVCLTVFFLLLVELIPAISLVIPLIGKYLLFTMMLVGASITATVFSLNFHYRSKSSHLPMSGWIRKWLLNRFPKYLMMHRFSQEEQDEERRKHMLFHPLLSKMAMNSNMKKSVAEIKGGRKSVWAALLPGLMAAASRQPETSSNNSSNSSRRSSSVEKPIKRNFHVEEALMGVAEKVSYLVNKMKHEEECKQVEDEWKFVAMVIDRMFLCIFSVANICGTMTIILNAPAFFDSRTPIDSTH